MYQKSVKVLSESFIERCCKRRTLKLLQIFLESDKCMFKHVLEKNIKVTAMMVFLNKKFIKLNFALWPFLSLFKKHNYLYHNLYRKNQWDFCHIKLTIKPNKNSFGPAVFDLKSDNVGYSQLTGLHILYYIIDTRESLA